MQINEVNIGDKFDTWEVIEELDGKRYICKCVKCGIEKEYSIRTLIGRRYGICNHLSNVLNIGDKFGDYTITDVIDSQHYICKCKCGKENLAKMKSALVNLKGVSCTHRKDLTGQEFGDWKVIKYVGDRMWECECTSCGNIKNVLDYSLTSGRSKSCGHPVKKDNVNIEVSNNSKLARGDRFGLYLGKKFGEWEVIGDIDDKYKVPCRCSCGKKKSINYYTLKDGRSTNCGHLKNKDRVLDLCGQTFGDLTAIKYLDNSYWECECSCGRTVVKQRSHLLDGRATSCGHDNSNKFKDLSGKQFGNIRVLSYLGDKRYMCRCEKCGKEKVIRKVHLLTGDAKSCGCCIYSPKLEDLVHLALSYVDKYGRKPSIRDLANMADVSYKSMLYHLNKHRLTTSDYIDYKYTSQGEREVYEFVKSITDMEIRHNVRDIVYGYELDIYLPDKKLAIEFNGSYWHSTDQKDWRYHLNKTIAAIKQGVSIIHIFEYEWNDADTNRKIKQMIKRRLNNRDIVNIKSTEASVGVIDNGISAKFCDDYDIEGASNSVVSIGITYENELIGVMTFGKGAGIGDVELQRVVIEDDINIVGGINKLFDYFKKNYKVNNIVAYLDFAKQDINKYRSIGFKVDQDGFSEPDYIWVNNYEEVVKSSDVELYINSLGYDYDADNEDRLMRNFGYLKIYDCGRIKLKWDRE